MVDVASKKDDTSRYNSPFLQTGQYKILMLYAHKTDQLGNFVPPFVSFKTTSKKSSTEWPMLTGGSSRELLPAARMRRSCRAQQMGISATVTLLHGQSVAYILEHLRERTSTAVAVSEHEQRDIRRFQILLR